MIELSLYSGKTLRVWTAFGIRNCAILLGTFALFSILLPQPAMADAVGSKKADAVGSKKNGIAPINRDADPQISPFLPPSELDSPSTGKVPYKGGLGADFGASAKPVPSRAATPEDRAKLLRDLYEQLEAAPDRQTARTLSKAIERLWLKSGSSTIDLLMTRALGAIHVKNLDLALGILDRVTKIAPDFTEAWNRRALVHYMKENYSKTMTDLQRVLSRDPRHFRAIHGLSLVFRKLGRKKAALKALRKAQEINPYLEELEDAEKALSREVEGQRI